MIYLKLLKVFFKENYSLKRLLGTSNKQSKTKTILLSILLIYGLGSILFSFGYLFFEMGKLFKATDSLDSLLTYIFMYATFLSVFFVLIRAGSYLFNYKDYDFLASLPIKNHVVIAAKLSVMMVMVYISVYVVTAPMIFSYFYHGGFSFYQLIIIVLSLLLIPIIPLIVFSFLSLLITYILNKLGISKIFTIVLTFGLLLAYMYFAFSFSAGGANPFLSQSEFLDSVSQYIPTVTLFFESVANQNILAFLLFIVINAGLLFAFIFLTKDLIHMTNQNQTKSIRKRRHMGKLKQRSVTESLILKEFKKFFSVNIYVMNSGFGLVLMFIGGVLSFVYADRIQSFSDQLVGFDFNLEYMILIAAGFFLSTVYTSAISLSLEGNNFWLIRSLPIKAKTIVISKMLFNVILGLPFAIFFVGAISFSLSFDFVRVFLMLLLVASFSLVTSMLGSMINLYFPKFNFKNETEVVKQSVGAFLGMFSGWGIIILLGLISAYLLNDLDINASLLMMTLFNLIVFAGGYQFINKKAESLFMKF
jgi:ABC-2 type transport system permease protein